MREWAIRDCCDLNEAPALPLVRESQDRRHLWRRKSLRKTVLNLLRQQLLDRNRVLQCNT